MNHIIKGKNNSKVILKGKAASGGLVKGSIKIIFGFKDSKKFQEGDILVTKMTEPSMVPMMIKASAIITDTGGVTCHAAIISRELGVPCVVATREATKILEDGMVVKVDGNQGKIYLIDE